MPQLIEKQKVWLNGFDMTTDHRSIAEAFNVNELPATTLGNDTEINEPGLKGWGFSGEALWEGGANNIDDALNSKQRVRNIPFSVALTDGTAGSLARSVKVMMGELEFGASVGELLPINYGLGAMDTPVQGTILHNAEVSSNTTGTAFQLGAVASGEKLYGTLHVFSGSGDLDVKIQSASDEAFTTPNDRITFAQVLTGTARASEWATPVDGAITDTWWRMTATVPGTRNFAVIAAIQ